MNSVYHESPIPTQGGVSLEGQSPSPQTKQGPPPRVSFALTQIHKGTVLDACMPSKAFEKIDACLNVTDAFPPTIVVHGDADTMVPKYLSEKLFEELKAKGVRCDFVTVPGEEHTFVGKMVKGSQTWDLQRKGFDFLEKVIEGR